MQRLVGGRLVHAGSDEAVVLQVGSFSAGDVEVAGVAAAAEHGVELFAGHQLID